jgi:hypothetical protein
MERTVPFILAWDENLDIGSSTGQPVEDNGRAAEQQDE